MIVEGAMIYASQLSSHKFFSSLRSSVNSTTLSSLCPKINHQDEYLNLAISIAIMQKQSVLPLILRPSYPDKTVRIEAREEEVTKLLDPEGSLSGVVVIYGFGGIGKTILADAGGARLNLEHYNYCTVEMDEGPKRNKFEKMQAQIVKGAFADYKSGHTIVFRNSTEGRQHLTQAFTSGQNKPVFLFIGNALRTKDLEEFQLEDLQGLPQDSKVLVTTINLATIDMLQQSSILRLHYLVNPLPDEDEKKILFNEIDNHMESNDVERILQICKGIPLALKIVAARLHKQNYRTDKCAPIFEALEKGKEIKQENLSQHLVDFVYKDLESTTKEAFLDVSCCYHNWILQLMEYVVGAEAGKSLKEAALISIVVIQLLEAADKYDPDKPSTSSQTISNTEKGLTWSSFIQSRAAFLKFVDDHIEKIDKEIN